MCALRAHIVNVAFVRGTPAAPIEKLRASKYPPLTRWWCYWKS